MYDLKIKLLSGIVLNTVLLSFVASYPLAAENLPPLRISAVLSEIPATSSDLDISLPTGGDNVPAVETYPIADLVSEAAAATVVVQDEAVIETKPLIAEIKETAVNAEPLLVETESVATELKPVASAYRTTLNKPAGSFKFNVVSDNMTSALNMLLVQSQATKPYPLKDFHSLIANVVLRHPDVRAVNAQLQTSSFASDEAFSAYLPQVSAIADAGSRFTGSNLQVISEPKRDGLNANLNVKQLLYDFGATSANYDAAKMRELASAERLNTKRSELAFRAANVYFELIRAKQLNTLAADNYASRLSIVNMVKERYELGGGSKVDVIRAEARLTDASAAKVSADIALRLAEAGYKEIFGESAAETLIPQDVPIELANQAIEDLAVKYGAVREAKAQLQGNLADAKAAESRLLPVISFELNGGRREQETYNGPYFESNAHLTMRYNLFTGGADTARKDQAYSRAEQTEQEMNNLVLQVNRSIAQSMAQVNEADTLVATRRDAVLGAAESLLAVKEHFSYKRGSLLDLLRSQEELYIAGRDYISANADRSISRYRLLHLTSALETLIPELRSDNF